MFGANDGLTTNLALVLGISATGVSSHTVLATGLAGLLAGALSMGAGEYVSVNSQLELLEASTPSPEAGSALPQLDLDANELALVYRARGMSADDADRRAAEVLRDLGAGEDTNPGMARPDPDRRETVGTGLRAGVSSFICFGSGAFIPVLPYLLGLRRYHRASGGRRYWSGPLCWLPESSWGSSPGDRHCARRCASCSLVTVRRPSPTCWVCSSTPASASALGRLGIRRHRSPRRALQQTGAVIGTDSGVGEAKARGGGSGSPAATKHEALSR